MGAHHAWQLPIGQPLSEAALPATLPATLPIGRPIDAARLYVLDPHQQPVPIGVAGELYIGGVAVGRGYLNRPELTAERFLPDPFHPAADARIYKTGDLARWNEQGEIEYLGRNDHQVKIRGFRIELGEIEARLLQHPQIKEACVVARADGTGEQRLVAYFVPGMRVDEPIPTLTLPLQGREFDVEGIKGHLRATLPEYMVPVIFVPLEALPLSPNGKLDRKALPAPEMRLALASPRVYEPPQNETETRLAEIWQEILQVEAIGRNDDFFALGGHSLTAVRLVARMNSAPLPGMPASQAIPLRLIFEAPTLAQLALALRQSPPGVNC